VILRQLLVKSVCRCRYIMAYENVIEMLENVVLEIRYESVHIHVCSLYSWVAQEPNLGLGCI